MRRQDLGQSADGVALDGGPATGKLYVVKKTTPTNSQAGFAVGCIWINMTGSTNTILYINTGTLASSTWFAMTTS